MTLLDRKVSARCQAHEVEGVGCGVGFIQIVHAPNKSALRVAPSAEVLDVQVANRENAWGVRQIPADLRPPLHPTIKSRSKEQEGSFGHVLMLEGEVRPDDFKLLAEPALEIRRGFEDVHGADLLRRGRARSSLCP